jgi:hemoglobin
MKQSRHFLRFVGARGPPLRREISRTSQPGLAPASFVVREEAMSELPSLYDRLGGEPAIESLVVAFYVRVMGDPKLAPFFRGTSIEKLHGMQREFFAMALGGPVKYTGRPIAHVHHGRGITTEHFSRFVGHLTATLEDLGASKDDVADVIKRVNSHANEVLGISY